MKTKKYAILFLFVFTIIINIGVKISYAKDEETDSMHSKIIENVNNEIYPNAQLLGVSHVYYSSKLDAEAAPSTIYSESKGTICHKYRIIYASPGYVVEYGCLMV